MDLNSGGVPPTLLPTMRPVVISGAEAAFVVASRTKLSVRAKALTGGLNSHLFVNELIKLGRRADAVKFIAAWLPPRESLWYATLGVWQTYRLLNQSGAEEILRRVAAFVRVPTADNLTAIGQAKEILRLRDRLNKILAHNTAQPLERIQNDTDRDRFMSAYEAKEYGLVDEVMHRKGPIVD